MKLPKQRFSQENWAETVEAIDLEIAQLAIMCQVKLLDPGVIDRVLANDLSLCSAGHETAFEKLRGMVVLHYRAQEQLAEELGPVDAEAIRQAVFQHLRLRVGKQLGGSDDMLAPPPTP